MTKVATVAVYVTLMRGEYDDQLQWPFEGDVIDFVTGRQGTP